MHPSTLCWTGLIARTANGARDRLTLLSKKELALLREYYKVYRPKDDLFEGMNGGPNFVSSLRKTFYRALKASGIWKGLLCTRCVSLLQPICWRRGRIFGISSLCLVTPILKPYKYIPISPLRDLITFVLLWIIWVFEKGAFRFSDIG